MTARDWAIVAVTSAGALVLVVVSALLANLFRVISGLKTMVDGVRDETVPLIGEVGNTVRGVNKELERVDAMAASVQRVVKNVETVSETLKIAVTNPLVKGIAFLAGVERATKKLRNEK